MVCLLSESLAGCGIKMIYVHSSQTVAADEHGSQKLGQRKKEDHWKEEK